MKWLKVKEHANVIWPKANNLENSLPPESIFQYTNLKELRTFRWIQHSNIYKAGTKRVCFQFSLHKFTRAFERYNGSEG